MKTMHYIINKVVRMFPVAAIPVGVAVGGLLLSSCEDFFDQESDHVIYSNKDHLNNWPDTVFSVMGILNKLQAIADRTILLGEVRGDLVTLTDQATSDLRDMANFNIGDDNAYNQPRDYYAVINNCNYYLANVDTTLESNRGENIFMKEYAAVKAIRAWTYLQLVLNYGKVPFFTEPILTKEESELAYPQYELADVCQFLLDDLSDIPVTYENQYPNYGDNVRGNNSRFFFFPINILRGELNLWLGSTKGKDAGVPYFREAALSYYKYISQRNGTGMAYPVSTLFKMWSPGTSSWIYYLYDENFPKMYSNETYSSYSELITMIPCDSIPAEGYYSELRNLFTSRSENNYLVSIEPSNRMFEISESQPNCVLASNGLSATYAPEGLSYHTSGDLRLSTFWSEGYRIDQTSGTRIETQNILKYSTRNVHIYRRQMLYLRMAEALNLAGYPRVAYKILERGLNNKVLLDEVYPYLNEADSTWVSNNLNFAVTLYPVLEAEYLVQAGTFSANTVGIHTRGSGWTPMNEFYRLVADTLETDEAKYAQQKQDQQEQVDSLIMNEGALEFCFEGTRYYDLMRFALRSSNPGQFLTRHVNSRGGEGTTAGIDLTDPHSWYMKWKGKIGY